MNTRKIWPLLTSALFGGIILSSCNKSSNSDNTQNFTDVETLVISDFVGRTALPQYSTLVDFGTNLNSNITILVSTPTDVNLTAAQDSWRSMRQSWERCEGFLIGPVESNDYDPNSDTWPTDYKQMDSLLASNNPLGVTDVQKLLPTLRGYHPIEYLLFGEGGIRKASDLDARKKLYLSSLSADLLNNNVKPLQTSWTTSAGGALSYSQAVTQAGPNNPVYASRQAFFLDVCGDNGMAGICNEVGQQNEDGKMYNPFFSKDSSLAESPYSGNSLTDFKNNIIGAQQVYLGINGGKGISALVAAKNKDLDNKIQAAFTSAVNSFDNISGTDNMRFEVAIFKRPTQIVATMSQLNTLQTLLDTDLVNFIKQYVKD